MIVSRLINHHFCEELWNHQLVSGISHVQRINLPTRGQSSICWRAMQRLVMPTSNNCLVVEHLLFPLFCGIIIPITWLRFVGDWSKLKPPSNSLKMGSRWPSHPAPGRAVFWLAMRFAHFLAWWVAWLQIMILAEDFVGVCQWLSMIVGGKSLLSKVKPY